MIIIFFARIFAERKVDSPTVLQLVFVLLKGVSLEGNTAASKVSYDRILLVLMLDTVKPQIFYYYKDICES